MGERVDTAQYFSQAYRTGNSHKPIEHPRNMESSQLTHFTSLSCHEGARSDVDGVKIANKQHPKVRVKELVQSRVEISRYIATVWCAICHT